MDLKRPLIVVVLLASLMGTGSSANLNLNLSLPAKGQYGFRRFNVAEYIKDMKDYFNQTKTTLPPTTNLGTDEDRHMNDDSTDVRCNDIGKWSLWGPKTRLFGCGEQHRERIKCNSTEVERRFRCTDPQFEEQVSYFKVYFVNRLHKLYGNRTKRIVKRSALRHLHRSLDLLFLVDRSQSMQRFEFSRIRSALADLVITMQLNISSQDTRVAMVTFGEESNLEFNFNQYASQVAVRNAIMQVPQYRSGSSQLGQALEFCADIFNPSKPYGARKNSGKVLLVLTDDKSTLSPDQHAQYLKEIAGVEIFVVGFKNINEDQMFAVSSHPKHYHMFYFETAQKVYKMVKRLRSKTDKAQ